MNYQTPIRFKEHPPIAPGIARVHFYSVDWLCFTSAFVKVAGTLAGYDMTFTHAAVQTKEVYAHMTNDGLEVIEAQEFYMLDDEQTVYVDVPIKDSDAFYDRIEQYADRKCTLQSMVKHGSGDTCVSFVLDSLGYSDIYLMTPCELYDMLMIVYHYEEYYHVG